MNKHVEKNVTDSNFSHSKLPFRRSYDNVNNLKQEYERPSTSDGYIITNIQDFSYYQEPETSIESKLKDDIVHSNGRFEEEKLPKKIGLKKEKKIPPLMWMLFVILCLLVVVLEIVLWNQTGFSMLSKILLQSFVIVVLGVAFSLLLITKSKYTFHEI
ncbi:uncharacterized protein LOC111617562 [Centruroides sculpturatus]|uniref:uncharacterized protein LOC111617561 n=1 Tax=Centruroides sculpturatus TaxID=218467 RepID=UPI000C6E5034|nr:uncharacterized protein LOC111617561 [Centruroides sculpturatus]XP_023214611.1 uncharacterized protein LOC111617562 [Centruroides sculpturatus]